MSETGKSDNRILYNRILLLLGLMALAGAAGWWMGKWSVPEEAPAVPRTAESAPEKPGGDTPGEQAAKEEKHPPVYLHVRLDTDADWAVALQEAAMAAEAGVHQYLVPVELAWTEGEQVDDPAARLKRFVEVDPKASFLLKLNLNPSAQWLQAHPADTMVSDNPAQPCVSAASQQWIEDAKIALTGMMEKLEGSEVSRRLSGYVPCALLEGQWQLPAGFDRSEVNRQGFRDWLIRRYQSDEGLQQAWGLPGATGAAVEIPAPADPNDCARVFLELPSELPLSDFLRYSSDSVADALASVASHLAGTSVINPLILAPYGYEFELASNAAGHFALGSLLESDIDGFLSPVSYLDRGLGGAGAFMGPVHSLTDRGKRWFVVDDTRTGMARDEATGQIARVKGVRAGDIFDVQRRNFAAALVHGLGMVWSDPLAEGWLLDREQWAQFGKMREIYAGHMPAPPGAVSQAELTGVTVVVDENSRFVQRCDVRLNTPLLAGGRDAAVRAGTQVRFVLFQDLIDDIAPPTPVYLFLNLFQLDADSRRRLHDRLARDRAAAVWLYAPGYVDAAGSVDNVSATTGMTVKMFDQPAETGTTFGITGQFIPENAVIGQIQAMAPLFYVEDENADILGKYKSSGKGSIAIKPQESGWTSVYVAEPAMTPALFCEILRILEQPMYAPPAEVNYYDATYAAPGLLAVHGSEAGKRTVTLGQYYDTQDLFDPAIGWVQKDGFMLPLRTGETRLFTMKPIETFQNPDDAAAPVPAGEVGKS